MSESLYNLEILFTWKIQNISFNNDLACEWNCREIYYIFNIISEGILHEILKHSMLNSFAADCKFF